MSTQWLLLGVPRHPDPARPRLSPRPRSARGRRTGCVPPDRRPGRWPRRPAQVVGWLAPIRSRALAGTGISTAAGGLADHPADLALQVVVGSSQPSRNPSRKRTSFTPDRRRRVPLLPLAQRRHELARGVVEAALVAAGAQQVGHVEPGPRPGGHGAGGAEVEVVGVRGHAEHALNVGVVEGHGRHGRPRTRHRPLVHRGAAVHKGDGVSGDVVSGGGPGGAGAARRPGPRATGAGGSGRAARPRTAGSRWSRTTARSRGRRRRPARPGRAAAAAAAGPATSGACAPAEHLLHPHRQGRRVGIGVVDPDPRAARHLDPLGGHVVEPAGDSGHGQQRPQRRRRRQARCRSARLRAPDSVERAEQRLVVDVGPRLAEAGCGRPPAAAAARGRPASSAAAAGPRGAAPRAARRRPRPGRGAAAAARPARWRPAARPARAAHVAVAQVTSSPSASRVAPASRAVASSTATASRTRASRRPGPRSATATASQGAPVSAMPGASSARGAGGHEVGAALPAPAAGQPLGVGQPDDQPGGEVVVGHAAAPDGRPPAAGRAQPAPPRPRQRARRAARSRRRRAGPAARRAQVVAAERPMSPDSSATTSAARRAPTSGAPSSSARASRGCAPTAVSARPRAVTRPSASTAPSAAQGLPAATCSARRRRRVEQRQARGRPGAPQQASSSANAGEVGGRDLRLGVRGQPVVLGRRPAAVDRARPLPAGPAGALGGRRPRRAHGDQRAQPAGQVGARAPGPGRRRPRRGRPGTVRLLSATRGGQHHPAARARPQRGVLRGGREPAVQRARRRRRAPPQPAGDGADLARAGQEDEHVAGRLGQRPAGTSRRRGRAAAGRPAGRAAGRPAAAGGAQTTVDVVQRARGLDDRGGRRPSPSSAASRCACGGGRHGEQQQVRAQRGADVEAEGEREVGVEVPLVALVEDDRVGAGQLGVALQPADQQRRW